MNIHIRGASARGIDSHKSHVEAAVQARHHLGLGGVGRAVMKTN